MLLAMDTSTQMVGLALYDGAQVVGEMLWRTQNHHTVELAPAIHDLLVHCGVQPESLKVIAAALGPGSFTSLRIGLAVAKGMALSLHIPVIGIPSLDILVAAQPVRDLPLIGALQLGRGRLAVGHFVSGKHTWELQGDLAVSSIDLLVEEIQTQTIVCGEFSAIERQALARKKKLVVLASPALTVRRPSYLAELSWKRFNAGKVDDPISLSPLYLSAVDSIPA